MAYCLIKAVGALEGDYILAPERYHPKRTLNIIDTADFRKLSEFVYLSSENVTSKFLKKAEKPFYLVNTGDAAKGWIDGRKSIGEIVNSNKKVLHKGDVIISRLRPYLKQVAFVDAKIIENDQMLIASTEFYVLSPKSKESIAFLVPFLLSENVQIILANAVEGGQHPRFNEDILLSLKIPSTIITKRQEVSAAVEQSINLIRQAEDLLMNTQTDINILINNILKHND